MDTDPLKPKKDKKIITKARKEENTKKGLGRFRNFVISCFRDVVSYMIQRNYI